MTNVNDPEAYKRYQQAQAAGGQKPVQGAWAPPQPPKGAAAQEEARRTPVRKFQAWYPGVQKIIEERRAREAAGARFASGRPWEQLPWRTNQSGVPWQRPHTPIDWNTAGKWKDRPGGEPAIFEKKLPVGAQGWYKDQEGNETGRPYYGGSNALDDYLKGFKARLDAGAARAGLPDKWIVTEKDPIRNTVETFSNFASALWNTNLDKDEDQNVVNFGLDVMKEGLQATLGLFQAGGEAVEAAYGATIQTIIEGEKLPEGESLLPKVPAFGTYEFANSKMFAPLYAPYNAARFLTSRRSVREKADQWVKEYQTGGKVFYTTLWGDTLGRISGMVEANPAAKAIVKGWEDDGAIMRWVASTLTYNASFEEQVRSEFIRRAEAGEDPYMLKQELELPMAELAFGVLFPDPSDLVLGAMFKGIKGLRQSKRINDLYLQAPKPIRKILSREGAGGVAKLRQMDEVIDETMKQVDAVSRGVSARGVDAGLFKQTAGAKRAAASKHIGEWLQWTAHNVRAKTDPDGMGDVLKAMWQLQSKNRDEVSDGLNMLLSMERAGKLPQGVEPFLSQIGMETGAMFRKLMGDDPVAWLKSVQKHGDDVVGLLEEMDGKIIDALDEMYPDILQRLEWGKAARRGAELTEFQLRASKVPFHHQALARFHKATRGVYEPVNSILAGVYMGMSPGYALRNFFSDAVTTMSDLGPGASRYFWKSTEAMKEETYQFLGGKYMPKAAGEAWGGLRGGEKASQGVQTWGDVFKITEVKDLTSVFSRMAEKFEFDNSIRIVAKSVKDTYYKQLPKALDTRDIVAKGLMSQGEADHFVNMVRRYQGNVAKAQAELLAQMATGQIRTFGTLGWLDNARVRKLETAGLYTEIGRIADEAASLDDFNAGIDDLISDYVDDVNFTSVIDPRTDPDGYENIFSTLVDEAVDRGFMDEGVAEAYHGYVVANQAARSSMDQMLDDAYEQVMRNSVRAGDPTVGRAWAEAPFTGPGGEQFRLADMRPGGKFWQRAEAYSAKQQLGVSVAMTELDSAATRDVPKLWKRLLNEEMPVGGNKRQLRSRVWDKYFEDQKVYQASIREYQAQWLNEALEGMSQSAGIVPNEQLAKEMNAALTKARYWDGFATERKYHTQLAVAMKSGNNANVARAYADIYKVTKAKDFARQGDPGLLNIINKYLPDDAAKYAKLEDVPADVSGDILYRYATDQVPGKGGVPLKKVEFTGDIPKPNPKMIAEGIGTPIGDTMHRNTYEGIVRELEGLKTDAAAHWDDFITTTVDDKKAAGIIEAAQEWEKRVSHMRMTAAAIANETKKFIQHDYSQRIGLDLALSYVFPYHFWHTRTYLNWMQRIVQNPEVIRRYAYYRRSLEKIHADQPEWWRYNVNSDELLGIETDNPLFFNLEATFNPVNGLTGVDYNDPRRQTNWWTSMLDQIDNFGPSPHTMLTFGTAMAYHLQNDNELAERWTSRLIPQTAPLRAITSLLNIGGEAGLELDPAVRLFSEDNMTIFERKRATRALAQMAQMEGANEAEFMEAAYLKEGPLWDQAIAMAYDDRALGTLAGFGLGVGFKARRKEDMQIDEFYDDYYKLMDMFENLSPEEVSNSFDYLYEKYPFANVMVLSRRVGFGADRAYGYSVLRRIPPGQKDDVFRAMGLPDDLERRFYEDKGKIDNWPEGDQKVFRNAIVDIGAILDVPDDATREEWDAASSRYGDMRDAMSEEFGPDIHDKLSLFYTAIADNQDGGEWLERHPEVADALDFQTEYSYRDPLLSAYYLSIDKVDKFLQGQMWDNVEREVGSDIYDLWDQYYSIADAKEAKAFWKKHEDRFRKYQFLRDEYRKIVAERLIAIEKKLPKGKPAQFREFEEEALSMGQYAVAEQLASVGGDRGVYGMPWNEWRQQFTPEMGRIIVDFFHGEEIPERLEGTIDRVAGQMDISSEMLLELMREAYNNQER